MIEQFLLFIDNKDKIFIFLSNIPFYIFIIVVFFILFFLYILFKSKNDFKIVSKNSINVEWNNNRINK